MGTREKKTIKPRPKTAREALDESIPEVITNAKPVLAPAIKRADQISVKGEVLKDYSIEFEDIDEAVLFYFDNVIKPSVIEDSNRVKVPVLYANPEKWKSAQADGGIRDKDGKVLFPVITIKKENIEKVRSITSKVDGNKVSNYHVFEKRYTNVNQYDSFSALNNRKPAKSYSMVVVPDYYKITYTCGVYVNMMEDLNKILEAIFYASDSYWGDPKRFTFMTRIDSIPITQEMNNGEDRKIYSVFSITLNGHIIPDSINKYMSSANKFFSKAQIIFNTETTSGAAVTKPMSNKEKQGFVSFPERIIIEGNTNMSVEIATYLAVNKPKKVASTDIQSDRFYLRNTSILLAPSALPPTSMTNFYVFVEGQRIEADEIISITQVGLDVLVVLNEANVGYPLNSTFSIEVIGKFV